MGSSGFELGGKYSNDPIGSERSRGKHRYQRKSKLDGPSWTPTEQRHRNQLMKQFCKLEGGTNSEAYRASPLWCGKCCGMMVGGRCGKCGSK